MAGGLEFPIGEGGVPVRGGTRGAVAVHEPAPDLAIGSLPEQVANAIAIHIHRATQGPAASVREEHRRDPAAGLLPPDANQTGSRLPVEVGTAGAGVRGGRAKTPAAGTHEEAVAELKTVPLVPGPESVAMTRGNPPPVAFPSLILSLLTRTA